MNLRIFSVHWNPNESKRSNENVARFEKLMNGFPCWIGYAAGNKFEQFIFQKEALLNALIRSKIATEETKAIAWIDADVIFLNPRWYELACKALEQFAVVQLFTNCHRLDANGQIESSIEGYQRQLERGGMIAGGQGYAWAARTEVFLSGGLFDLGITGGGDAMMAAAWNNRPQDYAVRKAPPGLREEWESWKALQDPVVAGRVSYIPGDIVHMYHGSIENRRYNDRCEIIRKLRFHPRRDVCHDMRGLLEWTGENMKLQAAVKELFEGRLEDE